MDLRSWSKRSRQIATKYGNLKDRYPYWEQYFPENVEQQYIAHIGLKLRGELNELINNGRSERG